MAHKPIDIVAAHFALYTAPCLDLIGAAPIVVHFHGPWAAESQVEGGAPVAVRLKAGIERSVYRRARRCITLSRAFADVLETGYGIPADRIDVIPGGVDVARWSSPTSREEARAALGWPQDRRIVFTVRRLARRMGLEDLVEAMATTLRRVPDAMLMVGGKGPLLEELQVRAHAAGVSQQVCFVGYVADHLLPLAFRAADLSVVPSASLEGFGLVVAESLASGTPALVSAVGGLPETIEGLAPQCIVREPGAGTWGHAIADALTGVTPLPLPAEAVRYARERFDWSVVLPRILHTYRRAMQ
jgi:glycosyltransferase involved in cell wall biosynthesis